MVMVLRCDCGFRVAAEYEAELVAGAQAHAREAHGTDEAADVILALLHSRRPHQSGDAKGDSP